VTLIKMSCEPIGASSRIGEVLNADDGTPFDDQSLGLNARPLINSATSPNGFVHQCFILFAELREQRVDVLDNLVFPFNG